MLTRYAALLCLWLLAAPFGAAAPGATEPAPVQPEVDMAALMARATQYTQPGAEHEWLRRFLGEWESEVRITLPGAQSKAERGTGRGRWLIEGRWLAFEAEGTMMGLPLRSFTLFGYDRFKKSYVTASVQSLDTALTTSEGDLDPKTGALLTYGTLDEYLTGEHDKMVKYVWRFPTADSMVLEVHDLPIGESGTQVLEIRYRRKPASR